MSRIVSHFTIDKATDSGMEVGSECISDEEHSTVCGCFSNRETATNLQNATFLVEQVYNNLAPGIFHRIVHRLEIPILQFTRRENQWQFDLLKGNTTILARVITLSKCVVKQHSYLNHSLRTPTERRIIVGLIQYQDQAPANTYNW